MFHKKYFLSLLLCSIFSVLKPDDRQEQPSQRAHPSMQHIVRVLTPQEQTRFLAVANKRNNLYSRFRLLHVILTVALRQLERFYDPKTDVVNIERYEKVRNELTETYDNFVRDYKKEMS